MSQDLYSVSLEQLDARMRELDEWARARDTDDPDIAQIERRVFGDHVDPNDDWNDYHRVRSAYDRLAAEEFDLGQ